MLALGAAPACAGAAFVYGLQKKAIRQARAAIAWRPRAAGHPAVPNGTMCWLQDHFMGHSTLSCNLLQASLNKHEHISRWLHQSM